MKIVKFDVYIVTIKVGKLEFHLIMLDFHDLFRL